MPLNFIQWQRSRHRERERERLLSLSFSIHYPSISHYNKCQNTQCDTDSEARLITDTHQKVRNVNVYKKYKLLIHWEQQSFWWKTLSYIFFAFVFLSSFSIFHFHHEVELNCQHCVIRSVHVKHITEIKSNPVRFTVAVLYSAHRSAEKRALFFFLKN